MNAKTRFLVRSAATVVFLAGVAALYVLYARWPAGQTAAPVLPPPERPLENLSAYAPPEFVPNSGPPTYPNKFPVYQGSGGRGPAAAFQHVGVLVSKTTPENPVILPLFGRPSPVRRERWEYYAASDKNTMLRLPVAFESRNCSDDDVGCREIRDTDIVQVPTYDPLVFTAQMYKLGAVLRQ